MGQNLKLKFFGTQVFWKLWAHSWYVNSDEILQILLQSSKKQQSGKNSRKISKCLGYILCAQENCSEDDYSLCIQLRIAYFAGFWDWHLRENVDKLAALFWMNKVKRFAKQLASASNKNFQRPRNCYQKPTKYWGHHFPHKRSFKMWDYPKN